MKTFAACWSVFVLIMIGDWSIDGFFTQLFRYIVTTYLL
jgi:hypothetical protein